MAWTITVDQGFDETYYLQAKAAQMGNGTTAAQALAAINAAGLTAAQHYSLYGYNEGLAPNAYFNADQYAASKAAQAGISVADFQLAWYNASGSTNLYTHYIAYGAFEANVEPSTGFDDDLYYAAKATQMGGTTTPAQAEAAIKAAGMNAISHYQLYGKNESLSYTPTPAPVVGTTYTLTTGVDTIVGGAGNDVVLGVMAGVAGASSTLQIFDSVNGGGGVNTMNLRTDGVTAFTAANVPVLNNIQTLNFTALGAAAAEDFSVAAKDMTTLNFVNSLASTTSVAAGVDAKVNTLGIKDNVTDLVVNTLNYKTGLTGAADALTVNLDNASAATPTTATNFADLIVHGAAAGDGFDLVTVNSNTSANRLVSLTVDDSVASTMSKLTITGTSAFRVNTALDFLNTTGTVDATNALGGVNLTFGAEDITATGGAGNDRFAFGATNLTTSDVLDGGAGTNTLAIADTAINSTTTTLNAAINAQKNFSVLELRGASANVDASILAYTDYRYTGTGGGALTISEIAGDKVTINNTSAGATALTPAIGTTTLDLTLTNSGTAAGGTTLNVTGINTLNLASTGSAGVTNAFTGAVTNNANLALNITGTSATTFGGLFSNAVNIDASASSGVLTITAGSASNDSIKGGSGADVLVGGAGNDTIVGNAGNDTMTGGLGADTITGGTGINSYLISDTAGAESRATGIVAGNALTAAYLGGLTKAWDTYTASTGDTISLTYATGAANTLIDAATTPVTAGAAATTSATTYWNDGTNTYLMTDTNADSFYTAADNLVVLTGVHTISLAAAGTSVFTITS